MRRSALAMGVCLTVALAGAAVAGKIIYMDDDANAPSDGKSWTTAYRYLQDALTDAKTADKPVEVRVAQGVYKPNQHARQDAGSQSFELTSGVALRGGYAGLGAADPDVREIELWRTILSGDLDGDDEDVNDLRDLLKRSGNSRTVVACYRVDKTAVLDGVSITGGNFNVYRDRGPAGGGGIAIRESDLTIANCTFAANSAAQGGAVSIWGGHPTFTKCTFVKNYAGGGGGAIVGGDEGATITNCTFTGNGAYGGGAVAEFWGTISNCTFGGNSAETGGGALTGCNGLIENCLFSGNSARERGGAVDAGYRDTPTFKNCLFVNNRASRMGGALFIHYNTDATLVNCTFSANSATNGNALVSYSWHPEDPASRARLTNCILWDAGKEIWRNDASTIEVDYSDVSGGYTGIGNIDTDPLFADPDNGDYHLKSRAGRWDPKRPTWVLDDMTSPCIDRGDPNTPIGQEPFPNGGRINMGAYGGTLEASKSYFGKMPCTTIIAGDINGDCKVNFVDLSLLARHWLEMHP